MFCHHAVTLMRKCGLYMERFTVRSISSVIVMTNCMAVNHSQVYNSHIFAMNLHKGDWGWLLIGVDRLIISITLYALKFIVKASIPSITSNATTRSHLL